jgi:cytochrome b6-f complex iron-sulfur subunit
MSDRDEDRAAERVDRLVDRMLSGGRLRATPSDASEHEAILAAAAMAGSRQPYPRMSPAFKRQLQGLLQGQPEPALMTRRAALVAGLGVAMGGITGAVAARVAHPRSVTNPQTAAKAQPVAAAPVAEGDLPAIINPLPSTQRWWNTGIMAEDLAENVPVRVSAGSVGAFIIRRGNAVVAVSAYCTHLPCELQWEADHHVLNCPCHNSAFDLDGVSMGTLYRWPTLPAVNVRVNNDGTVEVLGTA